MGKCIMVQGTASSVGKSMITAGLCRIFKQDGYRVAPFKSQNMALNSYITRDGKEMGRAQVVQAEAAGVEPSVDMNPILLKPTTDRKAQVILNGAVYKNMSAVEYHEFKPELADMVQTVYQRLENAHDLVVIEGAGSPAEINLRDKDIVNMGMAELADAPVLLVGDIDKGGVFASLLGTVMLLTEEEKKRVKGVIINKFRGDVEILKPGLKMLEDRINIPVLGVLPYTKLQIEDEDSLAERFSSAATVRPDTLDLAVIKLPHLSNFSDFNALERLKSVNIRYVDDIRLLGNPHMLILPGTKNTLEDMKFIKSQGFENEIKRLHQQGTVVFGICGGYQMLGKTITDPDQVESDMQTMEGLGLLNAHTVFQQTKTTTQTKVMVCDDQGLLEGLRGSEATGYEIHMGVTDTGSGCVPFLCEPSGGRFSPGVRNGAGTVFGTYLHGIFDNETFTPVFLDNLCKIHGFERVGHSFKSYHAFKEEQYDLLAAMIRENLDMSKVYEVING